MALPRIWSRRKRQSQPAPDVYRYDELTSKIRTQLVQIWREAFHDKRSHNNNTRDIYKYIRDTIRKEKGVFNLTRFDRGPQEEIEDWFLKEEDVDLLLDALELACRFIDTFVRKEDRANFPCVPDKALDEINERLREAEVGYQYQNDVVVRVDNFVIHKEVVVPALTLLSDPDFAGAESEFRKAHKQFRTGDYEGCLTECCKALESTLKSIGAKRNWAIGKQDTLKPLLNTAFQNALIPNSLQTEFAGLRSMLESGVGTVRNKGGGHGSGPNLRVIPEHLAAFQLHQTAAAIVFLVGAHKATP